MSDMDAFLIMELEDNAYMVGFLDGGAVTLGVVVVTVLVVRWLIYAFGEGDV